MSQDAGDRPETEAGDPPPPPPPPSRWQRFRGWHRALSTGNKLGFYGLVATILLGVTPLVATVWTAAFGGSRVAILVEQYNDPCFSTWVVPSDGESLYDRLGQADERQYTRWEREERLVHADLVQADVSLRGADEAIEIRDISVTVLRRDRPVSGDTYELGGCGSNNPDEPDYLVVDLDTLPVGREVPVSYLQQSDQQEAAREEAGELGEAIQLPRQVTPDDFYSFTMVGRTQAHDTDWRATITWWDGEELHTDTLDDDGEPFRVSAAG